MLWCLPGSDRNYNLTAPRDPARVICTLPRCNIDLVFASLSVMLKMYVIRRLRPSLGWS